MVPAVAGSNPVGHPFSFVDPYRRSSPLEGNVTLAVTPPVPPTKFVEASGKSFNTIPPTDYEFYETINALVQEEPATALDPELTGQLAAIGIVKGKPFAPDRA